MQRHDLWNPRAARAPTKGARATAGLLACAVALGLAGAALAQPKLLSRVALVLDNQSNRPLLAIRAREVHPIASLTKLMVALVARDRGLALERGTKLTRADHRVALNGSRTRLELNWVYRNRDLLHASLMSSDNRATSALGRTVGLQTSALVRALNERARRMGLSHTRFDGPVGIDHSNVSTAFEVARLARAAGRDPVLRRVMGQKEHLLVPLKGYIKVHYRNTNPLVGTMAGVRFVASKTGYNAAAGYCLTAVAQIQGRGEFTFVLLGAKHKPDRVRDLRALINWIRLRAPRTLSKA